MGLASLLPGVRHLRAPLAAGYLWLLLGWLVLHDEYERTDHSKGALKALLELDDDLSPIAFAVALSFLAYVMGTVWEFLVEYLVKLVRYTPSLVGKETYGRPDTPLSKRGDDALLDLARREVGAVVEWIEDPDNPAATEDWWAKNGEEAGFYDRSSKSPPQAISMGGEHTAIPILAHGPWVFAADHGLSKRLTVTARSTVTAVCAELDLVGRRLVGDHPEHFAEYDRLRSEGEFRTAIGVPLAAVLVSIGWGMGLGPGWLVVFVVLALALAGFMLIAGWARFLTANDRLADILVMGLVQAPVLQRLRIRAGMPAGTGHAPKPVVAPAPKSWADRMRAAIR